MNDALREKETAREKSLGEVKSKSACSLDSLIYPGFCFRPNERPAHRCPWFLTPFFLLYLGIFHIGRAGAFRAVFPSSFSTGVLKAQPTPGQPTPELASPDYHLVLVPNFLWRFLSASAELRPHQQRMLATSDIRR